MHQVPVEIHARGIVVVHYLSQGVAPEAVIWLWELPASDWIVQPSRLVFMPMSANTTVGSMHFWQPLVMWAQPSRSLGKAADSSPMEPDKGHNIWAPTG